MLRWVDACSVAGRRGRSDSDDAEAGSDAQRQASVIAIRLPLCHMVAHRPQGTYGASLAVWRPSIVEVHSKDVDATMYWETASVACEDKFGVGDIDEYAVIQYAENDYMFSVAMMSLCRRQRSMC